MSDPIRDRLATALSGTHTIEHELGGGGMARVFVATERSLGRQVVIKTMPDEGWSPRAAQRFHREILTVAKLQHAHIVPVLAAGDAEGMPYFTMPLVEGASLRERISRGPVPPGEAIGILRDVARALVAAHARGIVHRDIKPENVLLSAGAALVTDFGVAKAVTAATQGMEPGDTMTAFGVAVGTPAYMPPEQIAADPSLDHRADIYSWGVMAYELLSGERPFAHLTGTALTRARLTEMPPPLRDVAASVPAALAELVMRCLAKDPAQRPQSAAALLDVLDQPSGESAVPPRRPLPLRTIAAAALLAIAAGVALWYAGRRTPRADERVIAVAPFRVGGAAPETHFLREGLADVIVPQMQALPDFSALGVRVVFDRWRRAAGSTEADLDDDRARRVAADAGAGQLLLGEIVGTRARLTISARLLRARDGREMASARVEGAADSIVTLSTRLLTSLLALRGGASQARLQSVLTARPEALGAFLRGEQLYRRGRYDEAAGHFVAAWEADTGFALASLRIHLTNGWNLFSPVEGPWLDRAWRDRSRLSGADSLILLAEAGETYPAPMPRRARLASLRQLAERANTAEIWYKYGDFLSHDGSMQDVPDLYLTALRAFERAEALDSSFASALEHQSTLQFWLGDTVRAASALRRQLALDPDGDNAQYNRFFLEYYVGDASTRRQAYERFVRDRRASDLGFAAGLVAIEPAAHIAPRPRLADSLLTLGFARIKTSVDEQIVHRAARATWWSAGQPARAAKVPASPFHTFDLAEEVLAGIFWDADPAQATRASERLAALLGSQDPTSPSSDNVWPRFALAVRAFAVGDTGTVERTRSVLARVQAPPDQPWRGATAHVTERLLGAQLALVRRAPDLAVRLAELDSLLLDAPMDRRIRVIGNQVLAELFERHGDDAAALRAISRRDGQTANELNLPYVLRKTALIAERVGDRDRALIALHHFVALRVDAEPQFQAEVEAARRKIADLEARSPLR